MAKKKRSSAKQSMTEVMAKFFAEIEAGKITVVFHGGNRDSCLLFSEKGIHLLHPSEVEPHTYEFIPEGYRAPTRADIDRVMKSAIS